MTKRRLEPAKRRLLCIATVLAACVGVASFLTVWFLLSEDDTELKESFCCTVDQEECTLNLYCDSNATACVDCSGLWVAQKSLGLSSSATAPPTLRASIEKERGETTAQSTLPPAPTPSPTSFPTFTATGQACLEASKDGMGVSVPLDGEPAETILLERSAQLCSLWQVNPSRTQIVPVGRSYRGHAWEAYPGKFEEVKFLCDPTTCSLTLPDLPVGYSYELAAFDYELPRSDEVARFLEQTTFGPTRDAINSFPESFAEWILDQQKNVPLTSHRQFFRERATYRNRLSSSRGVNTHPCKAGARYRRYTLTPIDQFASIEILTDDVSGRKVIRREGQTITVLNTTALFTVGRSSDSVPIELLDGEYKICSVSGRKDGGFRLQTDQGCREVQVNSEELINPVVFFDSRTPPTRPPVSLDGRAFKLSDDELYLTNDLNDENCALIPSLRYKVIQVVVGYLEGQPWLFDSQISLEENTLENPLNDGGGSLVEQTRLTEAEKDEDRRATGYEVLCSNARMTFVNENYCHLSYDPGACTQRDPSDVFITLDADSLGRIFNSTGGGLEGTRYVYVVEGLRQTESRVPYGPPCAAGETSRWIPSDCTDGDATVALATNDIFAEFLAKSADENTFMRDITFPLAGAACGPGDESKYNFKVASNGKCWLNVHRSHLQVFDFTDWVKEHPGGDEAIAQFASNSSLLFPDWHDMNRWHGWSEVFRKDIGRYGDSIRFSELPSDLTTEGIASSLGAYTTLQSLGPAVVCGTPYEVKNKPSSAGESFQASLGALPSGAPKETSEQRKYVWHAIALFGRDQLRQRVAWALSQILVVSANGQQTEPWVAYYDIFVRHAFGSYRDILKEVSFSPLMGEMLTFLNNKGTEYFWREKKRIGFADENYAREIMQLFSIGLVKLNNDGSVKLDNNGKPVLTYTNREIVEYARVWTGFADPEKRGNVENHYGKNMIDTMTLEVDWRDRLPKLGLDNRYVGDDVPLCSDLPQHHFLRKGATYYLLGSISRPRYHFEPLDWSSNADTVRTRLDNRSSPLYATLCNEDIRSGKCQYATKVVLDKDLPCFGDECQMEAPRLVEVESGIFYEYVRLPCSFQAFFADGKTVAARRKYGWNYACAKTTTHVAGIGCCSEDSKTLSPVFGSFSGERVPFEGAKEVCSRSGLDLCKESRSPCDACDWHLDHWLDRSCSQLVKIALDGRIGLIHTFEGDIDKTNVFPGVREDTKTFFGVVWSSLSEMTSLLSDYDGMCTNLGCTRDDFDNLCLCPVEVREARRFAKGDITSRRQVLEDLHIGAFDPVVYWGPHPVFDIGNGVKMHSFDGLYSTETVFEVMDDNGVKQFRRNLRSDVVVGSSDLLHVSFRNPTHMMSIHNRDLLGLLQETNAALDHYFYHPNTAPFMAKRFAQRFGLSNPSPRLVGEVATAFRKGTFVDRNTGIRFGSGKYGNLGAMVAAVLLDRESRMVVLDADPTHGSLQEPFLRLLRIMRSLEFGLKPDTSFVQLRGNLHELIGQAPHELPDVFSFFLPEYQPEGPIGDSGLVCPECEVMSGPAIIDLMNGVLSLLKYGLDNAYGGFSAVDIWGKGSREIGQDSFATGSNRYTPSPGLDAAGAVDELATLLTSGRLSRSKRDLLQTIYKGHIGSEAYINVQQMIVTSPEFHTLGIGRGTGDDREQVEMPGPSSRPYKAVVQILLGGGWDSFNVLVPAECQGANAAGETVDEQYRSLRGDLAVKPSDTDLRISVDPALGQPCSTFAIHQDAGAFKELYDEGSLVFFANVGMINSAKMSKSNYEDYTVSKLFAHNSMQHEVSIVDPFLEEEGTGILGRMSKVLSEKGFSTAGVSIDGSSSSLGGAAKTPLVVSRNGSTKFNERPKSEHGFPLLEFSKQLNGMPDTFSSLFGETWSEEFTSSVTNANFLNDVLKQTVVASGLEKLRHKVSGRLEMVARLMQTKDDRGVDRDMFFIRDGPWDHHADLKPQLSSMLDELSTSLRLFADQLKSQGMWEDVAVVITSDFGRTLTMNGREGSDHAWGGHYAVLGGSVRGGRILGQYPKDLTEAGPWNVGRGRIMPTTSWESVWHGVLEWMGVDEPGELEHVLPNLHNTYGGDFFGPFSQSDVFSNGDQVSSGASQSSNVFGQ